MSSRVWTKTRLGDLCIKIGSGVTPRGGDKVYRQTGVSLIRSQNVYDYHFSNSGLVYIDDAQADKMKGVAVVSGDVLLNITGDSVARCCVPPQSVLPARVNQHVAIIRTNHRVLNGGYLLYVLNEHKTKEHLLSMASAGGTRKALTKRMIEDLLVYVPSIQQQHVIAATLSCLDDKIELNNRINKRLEEMAQAIFKSWFVDFEPFQNGGFEDSELGLIPKGWRVGALRDMAVITMGQSPRGSSYNTEGDGCVFYQGRGDFGARYPTTRVFTTEPKRIAREGDILLSVRAPVGDINVADGDCCIGRGLASIRSRSRFDAHMLHLLLSMKDKFAVFDGEGTVFGSINKNGLNSLKVVIPSSLVLGKFQNTVGWVDELYRSNMVQTRVLTRIRDTLLPKLMSGEIRVPLEEAL